MSASASPACARGCLGLFHGDTAFLVGFGFARLRGGFGLLHGHAAFAVGVGFAGLRLRFGLGHGDTLDLAGFGFADSALPLFFGDVDARLVDGFRGGALSDGVDVSALVGDVGDVDVQEVQADLVEFVRHVLLDVAEERLAVGVDLLDGHGRDHETQLTEDDVLRQVGDGFLTQAEQAVRRVAHQGLVRADADREHARHVDADVLAAQGVLQVHVQLHRAQGDEPVVLDHRPDERRAAVDAAAGALFAGLTVDHHDLVRRAFLVAGNERDDQDEQDDKQRRDQDGEASGTGCCENGMEHLRKPFLG